eukprot:11172394-Lingulodinium_polyedra.AAC.1
MPMFLRRSRAFFPGLVGYSAWNCTERAAVGDVEQGVPQASRNIGNTCFTNGIWQCCRQLIAR